jgi:hypothetical protein
MRVFLPVLATLTLLPEQAVLAQTEDGAAVQTPEQPAQQQVADPQITVLQLLRRGFEVKGMSYTNGAVIVVLQRGIDAFVCETDGVGNTRACVAFK